MKRSSLSISVLGLSAALLLAGVSGAVAEAVPVPMKKPRLPQESTVAPTMEVTGTIPRMGRVVPAASELKAGLDALSDKDAARAISIRNRMPQSLDRHMLTWSIAMSGLRDVPSSEIAAAQRELKGWPGLSAFRANSERALYREAPPAREVIAAFGETLPETVEGAMALAKAQMAGGHTDDARRSLRKFWHSEALDTGTEDKILADFSALFSKADHKARMDYLMYRGRVSQAKRFSSLGEAQSLYNAWAAVHARSAKADALIAQVDKSWASDPAYLFIRIERLRQKDKYAEAAKLLSEAPRDEKKLINAGEWWNEQRIVARGLADRGKFAQSYEIAAKHVATEPTDVVDAEFHAGWYALRGLKKPDVAQRHFAKILSVSSGPLSVSRAWYWLGRTAEAAGDKTLAQENFVKAANFPSTFYGQLAAARLKRNLLDIRYPSPSESERQRFAAREAVQAIDRFELAGHGWRAGSLYRALAQQLDSPGELALLTAKAERIGDHQLSLQIGKIAYGRGVDVPALAFPVGVIPGNADIAGSGKALAYAIARQESAFNPAAVSPANARGLLQILPGTAKGVATRHGLAYSEAKLTTDPGYNATLGAHYLGEQISSFGGSYILTFIAYNAGPKRVPEWIARYGDPRGLPIDEVVDWIERIPFPETRNYVQRVMENYQVYKARLGQTAEIEKDLRYGR
ncbi:lytic transglycosylase domain-containing protein [Ciceribacter sp. L1K23]|uniref:lytic transglycosylase domain-containing protein n=1 Tax=Ciceribacter sp. L1K23 TaxID=2820276 RepID=UPI001B826893|nr:lytic transglycosylase domain-containing protein [Ciceribacter sp. L1K23]MBR0556236.1 lytic transglycosylase domain-containing protein [Ciceribacter sp. L1K23]